MNDVKLMPYEVPPHLRKVLKKGEFAVYRLLSGQWVGDKFMGCTVGIPARDTIQDQSGNLHTIGNVTGFDGDGRPVFGDIRFNVEQACQITLHPGAKDASLYAFMEVTNMNKSNPNRDESISPVFERVGTATSASDERKDRALKVSAMQLASSLTDEEVLIFVKSNLNVPDTGLQISYLPNGEPDYEQMRNFVEALAERRPALLMKMSIAVPASETDQGISEEIDWASTNKIIAFDRESKQWYNGSSGKPFLQVVSIKQGIPRKELLAWLKTKEGTRIRKLIAESKASAEQEPVSNEK